MIISQGAFADLVVCLTEFSKNLKFQKKSLAAIETLKSTVPRMLKTPECPLSYRAGALMKGVAMEKDISQPISRQTQEEQFWFPILFAFHDVLMTGDDLEVRSQYVLTSSTGDEVNLFPGLSIIYLKLWSIMVVIFPPTSGTYFGGSFYIQSLWY